MATAASASTPGTETPAKPTATKRAEALKATQPTRRATATAPAAGDAPTSRLKMIDQLQRSMLELDLADSDDLREFCEAVRKLLHFMGVTVAMASGQMKVHARRAAKESADGLDLKQRGVLRWVLRKIGRKLDSVADHCGDGAANAVEAWSAMEEFISDVEAGGDGRMTRAKRKNSPAGTGFRVNRGSK